MILSVTVTGNRNGLRHRHLSRYRITKKDYTKTMPADLHVHTFFSDGTSSPEEVVRLASAKKINVISVTDHDTVEGYARAKEEGDLLGVEVIPGVELTAEYEGSEVHILGYLFDPAHRGLLRQLKLFTGRRRQRVLRMVKNLNALGVALDPEDVFAVSGRGSVGRMHIALALKKKGAVSSVGEAFERFIGDDSPSYVCGFRLSPQEAVKLIVKGGGIPVLAHPYSLKAGDVLIRALAGEGLMGLEVYYPEHTAQMRAKYFSIAKELDLLVTGGSDYHGKGKPGVNLGKAVLADELLAELKKAVKK